VAVAGDGFQQVVGLAGAAPAVVDFGFEVLFARLRCGGWLGAVTWAFAAVVATDFEGVAQLV
jgi:hypothetical protein